MDNDQIAGTLEQVAELLEYSGANPFRVRAYRAAADTLRSLDRPAADILAQEGVAGLERLENIGRGIAGAIGELVTTGSLRLLDELRAEVAPEQVFDTLPGVGLKLARRIHEELGVSTLEELEVAAHDGRLAQVEGIGPVKAAQIREVLDARLRRRPRGRGERPPLGELLDVDREYREKAEAGQLFKIAPRRFNPKGEAWLPILHTRRGPRRYTAVYSNTKLAHDLGKTHDWVVLYYGERQEEGQATVVTETQGDLAGLRVVRGREQETRQHYEREGCLPTQRA